MPKEENTTAGTGAPVVPPASSTGVPPVVPPVSTTAPASAPEMMQIAKADFDKLISTIQQQGKNIEVLFEAADKGRLAKANAGENGEPLIKTVRVRKWPDNNLFVLGWKLQTNQSEIVGNRWIEKQDTLLVFEDGSTLEVSLLDFYRKPVYEKAEILKRTKTEDSRGKEQTILSLRFKEGKVLEVDANYIN